MNDAAHPRIFRLALKLATGAGKTTIMATLIAWQTINPVRSPRSRGCTRSFPLAAPGMTIRDRFRALLPDDTDGHQRRRGLIPSEMLSDLEQAPRVIAHSRAVVACDPEKIAERPHAQ